MLDPKQERPPGWRRTASLLSEYRCDDRRYPKETESDIEANLDNGDFGLGKHGDVILVGSPRGEPERVQSVRAVQRINRRFSASIGPSLAVMSCLGRVLGTLFDRGALRVGGRFERPTTAGLSRASAYPLHRHRYLLKVWHIIARFRGGLWCEDAAILDSSESARKGRLATCRASSVLLGQKL